MSIDLGKYKSEYSHIFKVKKKYSEKVIEDDKTEKETIIDGLNPSDPYNENDCKMPIFFIEMLKKQYAEEEFYKIVEGFSKKRNVSFRVNTLKSDVETIKNKLVSKNIEFEKVLWSKNALIIKNIEEKKIEEMDIYKNGEIYMQSLSSMLPPIILNPKENTDILDMCAAPRW